MTSLAAGSSRYEHLLQRPQDRTHGLRIQLAERFEQPLSIDRAQLIEGDKAGAALETASRPPWVGATAGGHRRDDHRPEVLVQFVRRHDDAWSGLLDFTAQGGVEPNQADVPVRSGLPPLPLLAIEPSRRGLVKEPIFRPGPHPWRGCRPTSSRVPHRFDDQSTWFSMELHFVREFRFIEQRLRNTNPARVCRSERCVSSPSL